MTLDDFIVYTVLFGSVVVFGGAAVLALAWAVRDGQFQNFERSAKTIFDADEPIGEMTDYFPDAQPEPEHAPNPPTESSNGTGVNGTKH